MAASQERKAFQYTPYYGKTGWGRVAPRIGFKLNVKIVTKDNYETVLQRIKEAPYTSIDTETTSLKWDDCQLTQVNIGLPDNENYVAFYYKGYFPVEKRHKALSPEEIDALALAALHAPRCYFWNRYFDQRVLIHQRGFQPSDFYTGIDAMDLLWLLDTNVKSGLNLKDSAKNFLGIEPPHFSSLFEDGEDLTGDSILTANPTQLAIYGGYDAYNTLELGQRLYICVKQNYPFMLKLHRAFKNALYSLEEQVVPIDQDYLLQLEGDCLSKIEAIKSEFYRDYGAINLGSAREKSDLLLRLGYSTGVWNKPAKDGTPIMSTKAELLEELAATQDCAPAKLMVKYAKLVKFYSSYVKVMLDHLATERPPRFHYLDSRVPTMRLAAGKYNINRRPYEYFVPINIMAVSKPKQIKRWVHFDEETLDIEFHDERQEGDIYVESGDPSLNWRRCISAGPDYMVVKADMAAEELRIAAALSGEPVWVDAINNGVDLHKATAATAFGVDIDDVTPSQRKTAKTVNFGCWSLDSFIKTQRGIIRVRDLEPTDKLVSRDGSLQNWHGGVEWASGIRVHLSNGMQLDVSDDHPFRVFDSETPYWVLAKDLQEGDQLGLLSNSDYHTDIVFKDIGTGDLLLDEDFAYLLGLTLADGKVLFYKEEPSALSIDCHPTCATYVESILARFDSPIGRLDYPNVVMFRLNSWSVSKLVLDLIGNSKQKHVPDCIFQASAAIKRSFLAGFVDADGYVSQQHKMLLKTASPDIKLGLASLLADLGVAVSCSEKEYKLSKKTIGTVYNLALQSNPDLPLRNTFKIADFQYEVTASSLGFKVNEELHPVSWFQEKGLEAKDFLPVQVVKVESIGDLQVYEIECDSHEYQCQGLLSHNCLYDGNEYTIASRCKMPIAEAKEFYDNYTKALKVLYRWKSQRYQEGRTTGSVQHLFGHARRVYSYYHSRSRSMQAFADRTAVSNSIQGVAAIFMRIILTKLEKIIYRPEGKWYGKGIIHIANIHDEVDFLVPKKYAKEFCWDLKMVMESVTPPSWPVKMEASPEIGPNFGEIFEVSIVKHDDGSLHFVPQALDPPSENDKEISDVLDSEPDSFGLPVEDEDELDGFSF